MTETGSLRVLAYNTYLLPRIVMCTWDPVCHLLDANFESRAEQLGAAVAEANEKYDIVAFSEVWDEDARDILEERLGGRYPSYVKYISTSGPDMIRLKKDWGFLGGNFEDSGLMLFSRVPFQELPFVKDDYEATDVKPRRIYKRLAFKEFYACAFAFADCRAPRVWRWSRWSGRQRVPLTCCSPTPRPIGVTSCSRKCVRNNLPTYRTS